MANALAKWLEMGNGAALARRLGVTRQAIHQWSMTGVPPRRIADVARVTGIPIEDIRRDA